MSTRFASGGLRFTLQYLMRPGALPGATPGHRVSHPTGSVPQIKDQKRKREVCPPTQLVDTDKATLGCQSQICSRGAAILTEGTSRDVHIHGVAQAGAFTSFFRQNKERGRDAGHPTPHQLCKTQVIQWVPCSCWKPVWSRGQAAGTTGEENSRKGQVWVGRSTGFRTRIPGH